MVQAYVDDSASETGDKRLFLAGYVSTAAQWARFSDAWDRELHAHPRIDYCHMVEAQNRRGPFYGWSENERDRKILRLARIIPQHAIYSIETSVSRLEYDHIIKPVAPYVLHNPYFACYQAIVFSLPRFIHDALADAPPVDFIFDEHALGPDAVMWHDWVKEMLPPGPRSLLGGPPIFRSDKKVLPLQAADMLAWHFRRKAEKRDAVDRPAHHLLLGAAGHIVTEIDAEMLNAQATKIRKLPGVSRIQSRSEWRRVRRVFHANMAAGLGPPNINPIRMRLLDLLVRANDFFRRRMRRRR